MRRVRWTVLFLAMLLTAACAGEDGVQVQPEAEETDSTPAATPATPPTPSPPAGEDDDAGEDVLTTASSDLGTILVDGEGMALYVFDNDSGGESSCYDQCAQNWPPLTGEFEAGDGIESDLIGSTTRTDGSTQVTYADQPLYYYAADQSAGDTNGQGVGDVWWVVGPDGEKIMDGASASSGGY
jgi:predicted lipoprotein with Yx(FWY)xxD motif